MDKRFWRWVCMGVIRQNGKARTVRFRLPYRDIFDQLVLAAALEGRYKGSGEIIINRKEGLNQWMQKQQQLLKPTS
jgi:tellurite resistance protein